MDCPICKEPLQRRKKEGTYAFKIRLTCGRIDCRIKNRRRMKIGFHAPAWGKWNINYETC